MERYAFCPKKLNRCSQYYIIYDVFKCHTKLHHFQIPQHLFKKLDKICKK